MVTAVAPSYGLIFLGEDAQWIGMHRNLTALVWLSEALHHLKMVKRGQYMAQDTVGLHR